MIYFLHWRIYYIYETFKNGGATGERLKKKKVSIFFLFKIFSVYHSSVNQVNHGFFTCEDRNQLPLVTIGCSRSLLSCCLNLNDLPSVPMQFNRKINTPQQLAAALLKCFTKHATFLYRINVKTFQQLQFLGEIVLLKHYWHTLTQISRCSQASHWPVNSDLARATSAWVPCWLAPVAWKIRESGR